MKVLTLKINMKFNAIIRNVGLGLGVIISSCSSNEIGSSKDVNPDAIYFDYEISADEDREDVTVNLQYRMGGKNGTTLILDDPSQVTIDGEELHVDSSMIGGAYYEIQKPLVDFIGKHEIVFRDYNNNEYKEQFSFTPFALDPDVPKIVERGDLEFHFTGLEPLATMGVVLTDTSFSSTDINATDSVRNGKLVIAAQRLKKVTDGPINLEFYRDYIIPIKNGTKEGGRIMIKYALRREFELID